VVLLVVVAVALAAFVCAVGVRGGLVPLLLVKLPPLWFGSSCERLLAYQLTNEFFEQRSMVSKYALTLSCFESPHTPKMRETEGESLVMTATSEGLISYIRVQCT